MTDMMNCTETEETQTCNSNPCNVPVPMVTPNPAPLPSGPSNTCCYRFKNPGLPSFTLPPPQPASPGDITLNTNNPIVLANGNPINEGQGCNGFDFEFWDENATSWTRGYTDINGAAQDNINLFYATAGLSINIRTIQATQANMASILQGRMARLWITCNNGYYSCVQFTVGSTSQQLAGNENNNGQCPANTTHCQKCNYPTEDVCTILTRIEITVINNQLTSRNLTLVLNRTLEVDNCSSIIYELENTPDDEYSDRLCDLIAGQAQLDVRRISCSVVPSTKRAGGSAVVLSLNDPIPDSSDNTDVNVDVPTGSSSALSISFTLVLVFVLNLLF